MSQENEEVTFQDMPLLDSIHQSLSDAGFVRPTPIQAACIGPALEGKDLIGLAQTGTGKTAAFAIPIIQRMAGSPELGALVLAPTRELAAQITAVFKELGDHSGIRVATIVGGVPMEQDYRALRSWPNVLVATPGRLIDHIENDMLPLKEIEILTVDEADRMHDMGFMPQIRRIISSLPPKRQTMMFTATMHKDVEQIARKNMRKPIRIQIGATAPAHRATQELFMVEEDDKPQLLMKLLGNSKGRVLIFVRTKRGVDRLTRRINRKFKAGRIHGDLEQIYRDKAITDFREANVRILVATDIAARGLDISNIEHVINFDFPHHCEDYVHRIGRTARIDASGLATSFVTRADVRFVSSVRRLIGDKLPDPTMPDGTPVPFRKKSSGKSSGKNSQSNRRKGSGPNVGRSGGSGRSGRSRSSSK